MWLKALLICGIAQTICTHPTPVPRLPVPKDDVTFQLFTRSNPDTYTSLVIGELTGIPIETSKPFKFIIHGYTDTSGRTWVKKMKNAFLENSDCNVITVDWSISAMSIYNLSAAYTKGVGVFLAQMIIELCKDFGASYENIHLVGHSLGAHASGFAGKYVIKNESEKIGRITGLDPAGPLFTGKKPSERLSDEDALFVDVIHSDANKYGYSAAIGHVDFYPNGGVSQPGCWTRDQRDLGPIAACSHSRSYSYFTESINSIRFVATECTSYKDYKAGKCAGNPSAIMGEQTDIVPSIRGKFYLLTNKKSPYAKG